MRVRIHLYTIIVQIQGSDTRPLPGLHGIEPTVERILGRVPRRPLLFVVVVFVVVVVAAAAAVVAVVVVDVVVVVVD